MVDEKCIRCGGKSEHEVTFGVKSYGLQIIDVKLPVCTNCFHYHVAKYLDGTDVDHTPEEDAQEDAEEGEEQ